MAAGARRVRTPSLGGRRSSAGMVDIVRIPRERVLEFVKGGIDAVLRASVELPELVEPERDAELLMSFGIDPARLHGEFNGTSPGRC
jgi:hypothetical protein